MMMTCPLTTTVTVAFLSDGSSTTIKVCPDVDPAVTVNVVPDPETIAIDGCCEVAVNDFTPGSNALKVCVGCGDVPAKVSFVGDTVNCGTGVELGDGVGDAEKVGTGVSVGCGVPPVGVGDGVGIPSNVTRALDGFSVPPLAVKIASPPPGFE
jgi:hypothetical protein